MSHILIIDDDSRVASFVEKGLVSNGFTTTVVNNSKDALAAAFNQQFDLMILDLGLPFEDGFTVLEKLRGQGISTPVIILSARDDIDDKVAGFERGANDYLTKPFRFEELLVRIRARLREPITQAGATESNIIQFKDIELNLHTRTVQVEGRLVNLSTREFILAETFMRRPGQVLSREQLLDRVWGSDYNPGTNVVDVYIGYLRKKLGTHLIETVRGVGYRLKT